jgi:hypothetical protein
MIASRTALRAAIQTAEMIASRLDMPGHKLTVGERRVIAALLRDLADIGRRAFDPDARHDWGILPRPPRADDDVPGLFGDAA